MYVCEYMCVYVSMCSCVGVWRGLPQHPWHPGTLSPLLAPSLCAIRMARLLQLWAPLPLPPCQGEPWRRRGMWGCYQGGCVVGSGLGG